MKESRPSGVAGAPCSPPTWWLRKHAETIRLGGTYGRRPASWRTLPRKVVALGRMPAGKSYMRRATPAELRRLQAAGR